MFVRQYARRLEVVSPGGFPLGVTVDNIWISRSRETAGWLRLCQMWLVGSGQGMNLIFERIRRRVVAELSGHLCLWWLTLQAR